MTKLSRLLKKKGISQRRLGKESGLAFSTISEISSGKLEDYKISTVFKICDTLKVTPNDILDYEKQMTEHYE